MNVRPLLYVAAGLSAALVLSACDRRDTDPTAGQQVDRAVEASKDALEDATHAASAAVDTMGTTLADGAITTGVKARLAADDELKLLDIGVETNAGHTVLTGGAPNAEARDRATRIAEVVDGVTGVDNRLVVAQ